MKIKCLIIDDEPLAINVIKNYLEQIEDFELVTSFSNAIDGLNFLKSNTVDVIFLDINMPVINGWQFLNEIKKSGIIKNNNLTLYIVSSSTDTDDIMQAQSHDLVKNIFSKPLSINSIKHILQS